MKSIDLNNIMSVPNKISDKMLFLVLFIINIVIYWDILGSFIYVDEFQFIFDQRFTGIRELLYRVSASSSDYLFRPIHFLMFGLYYYLFSFNLIFCYCVLFIAHLLAALSVYYFFLTMRKSPSFAAIGAILFISYCGIWEAIGSIGGIIYPALTIFILCAFVNYINKNHSVSLVFYALALLSHEGSILFPLLLILYEIIVNNKKLSFNIFRDIIGVTVVTAIYILIAFLRKRYIPIFPLENKFIFGPHFFRNELDYMSTLVLPIITSYKMSALLPGILIKAINTVKNILMILAPVICIFAIMKAPKTIKFFITWIILTLLPFSFFVLPPVSRYLYLASIGYAAILAFYLEILINDRKYHKLGVILFLALLVLNLTGMTIYQKLFFNKKEIRRQIYVSIIQQAPVLAPKAKLCFIDLPMRDDEIKGMVHLIYKRDDLSIATINAEYASHKESFDPANKQKYDYIFIYEPKEKALVNIKAPR